MAAVHPGPAQTIEALRAENAALQQALAQHQTLLHQRAEPMLLAAMDALDNLCAMAEAGHPQARALIERWTRVQQRAQDAGTRLTVVRAPAAH